MIITFCGAQSTGKTTLLNYLSDRNPDFKFIPEVTRFIKRKYALPINEQGSILTQMMIMTQHVANAYNVNNNQSINVILDRCSIDGLIYTHCLVVVKPLGIYEGLVLMLLLRQVSQLVVTKHLSPKHLSR